MDPGVERVKTEPLIPSIINRIAEHEGVDPLDLAPPMYDVVDLEALDALFSPGVGDGSSVTEVTFTYNDAEVHVTSDGEVWVG